MGKETKKNIGFANHGRSYLSLLGFLVLFSLVVHIATFLAISAADMARTKNQGRVTKERVRVRVVSKVKPEPVEPTSRQEKKILEAPMEETEPPKQSRYHGKQNHSAKEETKVAKITQEKGLDPGHGGQASRTQKARKKFRPMANHKPQQKLVAPAKVTAKKPVGPGKPSARQVPKSYSGLMPNPGELHDQVQAGFQDYIAEEMQIGDRIDINTTDYRYIGYFTSVRKAFELVWTYPQEAVRKGLQGEVGVEFIIAKDGSLNNAKVIRSSGYSMLDEAVIEAIKLASPYGPLPSGFQKNKLVITGGFRYVLGNYGGFIAR